MGEVIQQLEKSARFLAIVRIGQRSCFLCRFIVEDLERNGRLTGYPLDFFDKGTFPVDAKLTHVLLEMNQEPPKDSDDLDGLASVVRHALEEEGSC